MNRIGIVLYMLAGFVYGLWLRDILRSYLAAPSLTPAADALTEITGIGPAFEQALHDLGIRTFRQLARQDADDLAARLGGRASAERVSDWIEQARERGSALPV